MLSLSSVRFRRDDGELNLPFFFSSLFIERLVNVCDFHKFQSVLFHLHPVKKHFILDFRHSEDYRDMTALKVRNVALAQEEKMDGLHLLMVFLSHEPCDRKGDVPSRCPCINIYK